MKPELRDRLVRCPDLPTLPKVAVQVLDLCQMEEPNLVAIATAIGSDPALTAKLLRLTNSPIYGLRQEVRTVSHAISMLGLNAVRTLALSFSLVRDLRRSDQELLKIFWRRSLLSATAARELAVASGFPHTEEAFLAALLQDIGTLALRRVAAADYEGIARHAGEDHGRLTAAEERHFGCDHTEVGSWLAARWHLPLSLSAAISHSHSPATLPMETQGDIRTLTQIVATSGIVADIWIARETATAAAAARQAACEGPLQIPASAFDKLLSRIGARITEVSALFDVHLGTEEEVSFILEQAKEALLTSALRTSHAVENVRQALDSLQAKTRHLEQEIQKDPLTGLANRHGFDTHLGVEFAQAQETLRPLSLIMADIDHFKVVNDSHGHPAGDKVLSAVAGALGRRLRPRDLASRYGGEEFALVLPETDANGCAVVAERVRQAVATVAVTTAQGKSLAVTITLGCATLWPDRYPTREEFVEAADRALYSAKRAGRNRVVKASDAYSR